jgi:hypothetical protein
MIVTLNLISAMEPRSTPHRRGRGYKRPKLAKHMMTNICHRPSVYIERGDLAPKQ